MKDTSKWEKDTSEHFHKHGTVKGTPSDKSRQKKESMAKNMVKNYADESPKDRYKKERGMTRVWEKQTGKSIPHQETAKYYKK